MLDTIWQDLRYGFRLLLKNPGFTVVAVLTLALGIGANTAIFSIVNGVLFRSLPYRNADKLVMVWHHRPQNPTGEIPASFPDVQDWKKENHVFEGLAAYAFNRFRVTGQEGPDETRGIFATPDLFPVLGANPLLGRTLLPSDDRERVVVLSHRLWQRRYNGDPAVIGKTIVLNAESYAIVGVMPPGFLFPTPEIELWLSFASIYSTVGNATIGDWISSRSLRGYRVIARLKNGVSIEPAEAEMNTIANRLAHAYPDSNANLGIHLVPIRKQLLGNIQAALLVLLGAVGFILLMACANVANLMLVRTATRDREIAVRRALGAGQFRLVRQLLTESLLLAILGGMLGLLLAFWGVDVILTLSPDNIPRLDDVRVEGEVFAYTAAISILTGVLFGLAPVAQTWKLNLNETLKAAGRGSSGHLHGRRIRGLLVVVEFALALVLLIGAGLMMKSFTRLVAVNPGFNPDHVLTMQVGLTLNQYQKAEQQVAFFQEALRRIAALPGVEAVGASTSMPPMYTQRGSGFTIEGHPAPPPGQAPTALYMPATPGYWQALGIPLLKGRFFTDGDTADAPSVAVINETLARQHFPQEVPLGQRIRVDGDLCTVVGIVGDVKYTGLGADVGPQIFVPHAQNPFPGMYLVIRTTPDPQSLIAAIRTEILAVDPEQGPTRINTMDELLSDAVAQPRFNTFLIGLFGALGLILAAVGIYGVMSFSVAQRTHEIGIRMALGAQSRDVLKLIVRQGVMLALMGVGIGLAAALALTRLMEGLLFSVSVTDPTTFVAISGLLIGVALVACYIPARRATRVDPMVALRYE
jgi:putative ABC transport system permease protein